jgi:nitrogen fixation NifU-like protein
MSDLTRLYQQALMAEAVDPFGRGQPLAFTHRAEGDNPLCGDHIELLLQVESGVVQAAAFTGESCAVCLASASLLCRHLPGQPAEAAAALAATLQAAMQQQAAAGSLPTACPEGFERLLGVAAYPARIACAMLPLTTAEKALNL